MWRQGNTDLQIPNGRTRPGHVANSSALPVVAPQMRVLQGYSRISSNSGLHLRVSLPKSSFAPSTNIEVTTHATSFRATVRDKADSAHLIVALHVEEQPCCCIWHLQT